MKKTKISVVMSVYNAEGYLAKAIESILNQTFQDFEFIIINDGSTDNSLKIIKNFMNKDKRIKLIRNNKNIGLTKSLNKGLRIAKGKYIARMDADDISLPERFRIQYEFLEKNKNVFLIGTNVLYIDKEGNEIASTSGAIDKNKLKEGLINGENAIHHPTIMFRNEKDNLYREKLLCSQDYDFYLTLLSKEKNLLIIKESLLKFRILNEESISMKKSQMQTLCNLLAKKFFIEREKFGKDSYEKINAEDIDRCCSFLGMEKKTLNQFFIKGKIRLYLITKKYRLARNVFSNEYNWSDKEKLAFLIFVYIPSIYRLYRKIRYGDRRS